MLLRLQGALLLRFAEQVLNIGSSAPIDNVKYRTGRNLRDAVNFSRFKSVSGGDSWGMNTDQRKQYSVIITEMLCSPPQCKLWIRPPIAFATLAARSIDVAGFSSLSLTFVASLLPISNSFAHASRGALIGPSVADHAV